MSGPKIACICVIGKTDNPLHISMFPPYQDSIVNFSFSLNACLDIFEIRQKKTPVGQDLGLLHAIDERLAAYGWLTTTGVKFLIMVDTLGQPTGVGAESLGAFRALQTAYVQLLQNPFYFPDDYTPTSKTAASSSNASQIVDQKFIAAVKRIGDTWAPGMTGF
ncbi:uncharacterized protein Aud_007769 [Aspergillus udagawae]|uniref:Sedlin n=1 Tax=Aspergillus udagawae TaxID=91492 RepID=A0A8E0QYL5_9EURO|nr:uncharacterized protein Aud_007769 [Aspergillus udagawae]GIC91326.1 hypothetical protein Aud_007769 [Aspergillus udagawae]